MELAMSTEKNMRDLPKIADKIKAKSDAGETFFSFEYFPPKTPSGVDNLHARIDRMAQLEPLFCDITWGARGSTATLTMDIAANIQKYHGLDCMMHLTCTNMPAETAMDALKTAKESGLHNILALRGDAAEGEEWKAIEGGFGHAIDLVKFIRKEHGDYFSICVAGYPEGHPDGYLSGTMSYEDEMNNLKAKIDAGGDFIITQMFFDVDGFLAFVKRCRDMGIGVPIVPGIMPIMNYGGFEKMTGFCKTKIPPGLQEELDKVKDDPDAVKEFGIRYGIDMCRRLVKSGLVPGLHFYSLNQDYSVFGIIDGLGFVSTTEAIRSLPFRPCTIDARRGEKVRPVYWANRFKSYLKRSAQWEKYPEIQWSNGAAREFAVAPKPNVLRDEPLSEDASKKLLTTYGEVDSVAAVGSVFAKYYGSQIATLPWFEVSGLSRETVLLSAQLVWMSKMGFFVINAQSRVNGALSTDPAVGWGAKGGVVYQKPYLEFFASEDQLNALMEAAKEFPSVSISAMSKKDESISKTNVSVPSVNSVTWGVFPNSEVLQPSVLDSASFPAWKDEAFGLWESGWACLYADDSKSAAVLKQIADTYYLVSMVDNDFVQGDVFKVVSQSIRN